MVRCSNIHAMYLQLRSIALAECMNSWSDQRWIGLQQCSNASWHVDVAAMKTGIDLRDASTRCPTKEWRRRETLRLAKLFSCTGHRLLFNALLDGLLNGSGGDGQMRHGTDNVNCVHQ